MVVPDALAELRPGSAETEGSEGEDSPIDNDGAGEKTRRRREIVLDQVRSLNDFMAISTHRGGRRVAVLAPAEALRIEAANRITTDCMALRLSTMRFSHCFAIAGVTATTSALRFDPLTFDNHAPPS